MRTLTMLFYLLLGSSLTIFFISNFDQRVVVYFGWPPTLGFQTVDIPLALALLGAMVAGFVVAAFLAITDQFRLRTRLRQLRKTNERLESELEALRNLPLTSLPLSEGQHETPETQDTKEDTARDPEPRLLD